MGMSKHFPISSLVALLLVGALHVPAVAQAAPTALQPGPNAGTADSFLGPHVWYFLAQPGQFTVRIDALGLSTTSVPINGTFSVRAQFASYVSGDHISLQSVPHGVMIHGSAVKPTRVLVTIIPPNSALVRDARNYQIEADGAVAYRTGGPDPIIGGFIGRMNNLGATRFEPNGAIEASDGSTGRWILFDPQLHIYTLLIGDMHLTVKLTPGVGLVDASNGNIYFESPH
jgi:hypothetical protein